MLRGGVLGCEIRRNAARCRVLSYRSTGRLARMAGGRTLCRCSIVLLVVTKRTIEGDVVENCYCPRRQRKKHEARSILLGEHLVMML